MGEGVKGTIKVRMPIDQEKTFMAHSLLVNGRAQSLSHPFHMRGDPGVDWGVPFFPVLQESLGSFALLFFHLRLAFSDVLISPRGQLT